MLSQHHINDRRMNTLLTPNFEHIIKILHKSINIIWREQVYDVMFKENLAKFG